MDSVEEPQKLNMPTAPNTMDELREALLMHKETSDWLDFSTSASLASIYSRVSTLRKETFDKIDRIKRYYIVDLIVSQIIDDVLTPEVGTRRIIKLSSKNVDINKELESLGERVDLNTLVTDIAADLINYGEYYLSTVIKPKTKEIKKPVPIPGYSSYIFGEADDSLSTDLRKQLDEDVIIKKTLHFKSDEPSPYGLINVLDNVNQGQIVTLTYHGEVSTYLVVNDLKNLEVHEPADFIRFSLPGNRIRIDLHKELEALIASKGLLKHPEITEVIPRYLRVGKSLIWPVVDKLGELEILEALVPATKLNKITAGSIVGFQVPASMDINTALDAAKRLEGILNKKQGIDPTSKEMTVTQIMSTVGRFKTVPIFGEKGNLNPLNYQTNDPEDLLNSIQDLRRIICESIGFPFELLFKAEDMSKGQILKKYSRYLRKLKGIQKAIEDGARQMAYIHLANIDMAFEEEDIVVEFFNPLIGVDNLDVLEFTDTSIAIIQNIVTFVQGLKEIPYLGRRINLDGLSKYVNSQLSTVGLGNILFNDEELKKMGIDPKELLKQAMAEPAPMEAPPPPRGAAPSPKPSPKAEQPPPPKSQAPVTSTVPGAANPPPPPPIK